MESMHSLSHFSLPRTSNSHKILLPTMMIGRFLNNDQININGLFIAGEQVQYYECLDWFSRTLSQCRYHNTTHPQSYHSTSSHNHQKAPFERISNLISLYSVLNFAITYSITQHIGVLLRLYDLPIWVTLQNKDDEIRKERHINIECYLTLWAFVENLKLVRKNGVG